MMEDKFASHYTKQLIDSIYKVFRDIFIFRSLHRCTKIGIGVHQLTRDTRLE